MTLREIVLTHSRIVLHARKAAAAQLLSGQAARLGLVTVAHRWLEQYEWSKRAICAHSRSLEVGR